MDEKEKFETLDSLLQRVERKKLVNKEKIKKNIHRMIRPETT